MATLEIFLQKIYPGHCRSLIERRTVEQKVRGSNTGLAKHVFNDFSFKRGNEPKGYQEEQELK